MKTTPIPTAKEKRQNNPIAFKPGAVFDGRREIKAQQYGYEYTLVEVIDRATHLDAPNFMGHYGFALKCFRKIKIKMP